MGLVGRQLGWVTGVEPRAASGQWSAGSGAWDWRRDYLSS